MDLPTHWKFDDDPFSKHKKQEGIPLDKILFATRVYNPRTAGRDAADLLVSVRAYGGSLIGGMIPKIIKEAKALPAAGNINLAQPMKLKGFAQLILEVDFLKKRFILGKALSHARPGEPFDIVLSGCPSI